MGEGQEAGGVLLEFKRLFAQYALLWMQSVSDLNRSSFTGGRAPPGNRCSVCCRSDRRRLADLRFVPC